MKKQYKHSTSHLNGTIIFDFTRLTDLLHQTTLLQKNNLAFRSEDEMPVSPRFFKDRLTLLIMKLLPLATANIATSKMRIISHSITPNPPSSY